jgi:hypothetical protein
MHDRSFRTQTEDSMLTMQNKCLHVEMPAFSSALHPSPSFHAGVPCAKMVTSVRTLSASSVTLMMLLHIVSFGCEWAEYYPWSRKLLMSSTIIASGTCSSKCMQAAYFCRSVAVDRYLQYSRKYSILAKTVAEDHRIKRGEVGVQASPHVDVAICWIASSHSWRQ